MEAEQGFLVVVQELAGARGWGPAQVMGWRQTQHQAPGCFEQQSTPHLLSVIVPTWPSRLSRQQTRRLHSRIARGCQLPTRMRA